MKLCFTESVRFDPAHLETLVVIADEGTFEAAARRLHLTPSAVSQRIRALEGSAGQVLVRRTSPASVTDAGAPLLRLGRQLRLLADEAEEALGDDGVTRLPVAVNADSLATWFLPVLAAAAARPRTALHLQVEDESYSHDLLRSGEVMAAVTSEPRPVQGCSVETLGSLRYTPAARPTLLELHRRGRGVDRAALPMVIFNERDHLQDRALPDGVRPDVVHRVPSTQGHIAAVLAGLGWGMIPDPVFDRAQADGTLAPLPGAEPILVTLHWQRWRLASAALEALTDDVCRAAADALSPA